MIAIASAHLRCAPFDEQIRHLRRKPPLKSMATKTNAFDANSSCLEHEVAGGTAGRFHFIDGLRGVAAVSVLMFHLWFNADYRSHLRAWCPDWLDGLLMNGCHGVDIFFVISGFVIAHSIRNMQITAGSAANFALRRHIRLDPPYWLCIFTTSALIAIAAARKPEMIHPVTSGQIIANMFYLQGILNMTNIVRVSWTLCLEVQFYFVLLLIAWVAQRFSTKRDVELPILFALTMISLAWKCYFPGSPWFVGTWYLFALGIIAYRAFVGRIHHMWIWPFAVATFFVGFFRHDGIYGSLVGPGSAVIILSVGQLGYLGNCLSSAFFKYLGAISYSLYLVHFDLVSILARTGIRMTGTSPFAASVCLVLTAAAAFGAAHVLHVYIERPSMRFAASLKRQRAPKVRQSLETPLPYLS